MKFFCYYCKSTFDEPKAVLESRGEFWGMPAFETMHYCPKCSSDDFDEIMEMDSYENPIYTNDYYYHVEGLNSKNEVIWKENYAESSMAEHQDEILDSRCIVERRCS